MATTWQSLVRGDRFRLRTWSGDEAVLYDALSGDTHLLEPLAVRLLGLLDDGPRAESSLLAELLLTSETEAGTEAQTLRLTAATCLAKMNTLGLVSGIPA